MTEAMTGTDQELTITRVFDAPRELLFEVWTNPDHLAQWWGPKDCTTESWTVELEPGGAWRTCLHTPDGVQWARGGYREIDRPERLVFSFSWEEPDGSPEHDTLVTITFAELGDKTEMTFRQAVLRSVEERDDHADGWRECFDHLTAYLKETVR